MSHVIKPFVIMLFASLIISGCDCKDGDGPQLPAETQTGEGTFGCIINVKPSVANKLQVTATNEYTTTRGYTLQIKGAEYTRWAVFLQTDSLKV